MSKAADGGRDAIRLDDPLCGSCSSPRTTRLLAKVANRGTGDAALASPYGLLPASSKTLRAICRPVIAGGHPA